MAWDFNSQLAKIEHDMLKAGYPASNAYLALYNECKKYADEERGHHYFMLYKQNRDIEEQVKIKDEQLSLQRRETANQNAIEFMQSQSNYYACPENSKQITDHMIANGIAPTVDGFRKAYYTLRALGVLKTNPDAQNFYGKGLSGMLGGALAAGAQQAVGKVPHLDTALAQQQAQAHMIAQMANEQKSKTEVVTVHVGRKFREDI
jgi:hypothetical protein